MAKKPRSIVLSSREFRELQRVCALTILEVQAIQRDAAQRIAAAQARQRESFARLQQKYRSRGMRADTNYKLDEATHALIEVKSDRGGD